MKRGRVKKKKEGRGDGGRSEENEKNMREVDRRK